MKQLMALVLAFLALSIIRGSQSLPSLVGIPMCSFLYWVVEGGMVLLALFFYRKNMHFVRVWTAPELTLG
jgi:hypothetical protein